MSYTPSRVGGDANYYVHQPPTDGYMFADVNDAHHGQYASGVVKVWHDELGWGGLTAPSVSGDVWAHFSAIDAPGYRYLTEGDAVEFRWLPIPHEDERLSLGLLK